MSARATTAVMTTETATVTVRVPLAFRQCGGAKRIITPPDAVERRLVRPQVDSTIVKALARAHRWERLLRGGAYATIAELAASERINASYLARVLRLTLLAPDIVDALLNGSPDLPLTLQNLLSPFPVCWEEQRAHLIRA